MRAAALLLAGLPVFLAACSGGGAGTAREFLYEGTGGHRAVADCLAGGETLDRVGPDATRIADVTHDRDSARSILRFRVRAAPSAMNFGGGADWRLVDTVFVEQTGTETLRLLIRHTPGLSLTAGRTLDTLTEQRIPRCLGNARLIRSS